MGDEQKMCGTRFFFVLLLLPLLGRTALAYESIDVSDGAKIRGVVRLTGTPKAPGRAIFPKDLDPKDKSLCDAKRPLITPFYETDEEGGLAHVVVWLEGIEKGKPKTKAQGSMINESCRFRPHVQSLDVGAKIQIENQDPILHTTHAIYEDERITAFNVGTPRKGQVVKKKVRRPGVLKVQCDSGHTWMRAWVHVFGHPYHTVTAADGTFELSDIPPGNYTLRFWHENSKTQTIDIAIEGGEVLEKNASFEVKPLPEGHEKGHHHH